MGGAPRRIGTSLGGGRGSSSGMAGTAPTSKKAGKAGTCGQGGYVTPAYAYAYEKGKEERKPLNASFSSRGKARGRDLQAPDCLLLEPGYESSRQGSSDAGSGELATSHHDGWGPKEGGNATSPLHSRGSPTKGTKSEVKTYAGGHPDAPRNKAWIQRLSRFPQ